MTYKSLAIPDDEKKRVSVVQKGEILQKNVHYSLMERKRGNTCFFGRGEKGYGASFYMLVVKSEG